MCIYVYKYIFVFISACLYMIKYFTNICVYVWPFVCVLMYEFTSCLRMCVNVWIFVSVFMFLCVYVSEFMSVWCEWILRDGDLINVQVLLGV